jgi:hypothetical protein
MLLNNNDGRFLATLLVFSFLGLIVVSLAVELRYLVVSVLSSKVRFTPTVSFVSDQSLPVSV